MAITARLQALRAQLNGQGSSRSMMLGISVLLALLAIGTLMLGVAASFYVRNVPLIIAALAIVAMAPISGGVIILANWRGLIWRYRLAGMFLLFMGSGMAALAFQIGASMWAKTHAV